MTEPTRLVVFSDLDGTLLDHHTYSWAAAADALERLNAESIPLVLVSSKTLPELIELRSAMNNSHPCVFENGAGTLLPANYFAPSTEAVESTVMPRDQLQTAVKKLRKQLSISFTSFAELGVEGIVKHTGLTHRRAALANQRVGTEPLLWQDDEAALDRFSAALADQHLRCVRGGRFVHVMGQFDKADAVEALIVRYRQLYATTELLTISAGDGPNDAAMLEQTDYAIIVKAEHGHRPMLKAGMTADRVILTEQMGPAGWQHAITQILNQFKARTTI